jgi:hypothetical protein
MYGYEDHVDITPEQLLQKITQEQIFEFVLEEPFDWSARYISPFRIDRKPGCRFEQRDDGTILFVDFGERYLTGRTHRSCFRMVIDKFNATLQTSIKIICKAFNLSMNSEDYSKSIITTATYSKQTSTSTHSETHIDFTPKEFNRYDTLHWSQFLIKTDHLKEDNVYSVFRFSKKNQKGFSTFTPYRYCYAIDFIDAVKIYQPYNTNYKWITNCNEDHIGNIDNLPAIGDELVIQKSYKDHRVLRNLLLDFNVIWFGNEGVVPSMEILVNLSQRFKLITIFFDNDMAGTLAAMKLVEIFNSIRPNSARMVHLPNFISRKLTHKDPSQFIHKEGRLDLIEVLKQIGLYGTVT